MVINAQNKEKYLEDLKNWLCELESAPLEEMGAFFRKRLPEYEARMTKFWGEDYKQFARAVPQSAKRILDLGCGTGLELDALYNLRADISVIGIDLSPDMLDALMKKHGDAVVTAAVAAVTAAIAAAVTARRTLRLRTGHVHRKHLAFELAAVDPVDGFLPLAVIGHLDEPESAGTPRLPIGNHICRRYFAELCK